MTITPWCSVINLECSRIQSRQKLGLIIINPYTCDGVASFEQHKLWRLHERHTE